MSKSLDFVLKIFLNNLLQEFINTKQNFGPNELAKAIIKTLKYVNAYNFQADNFYPIMQHLFQNLYKNVIFDIQILIDITKGFVDYSQFSNTFQGPLPILEAITLITNYENIVPENNDKIKVIAQNHFCSEELLDLKEESYRQIKQSYADFRVMTPDKLIFFDVKAKTNPIDNVGLFKGALGLTINGELKKKYIKKLLGDFPSILTNKFNAAKIDIKKKAEISLMNAKSKKEIYNKLYAKIKEVTIRPITTNEKYTLIRKEIQGAMLNPDLNLIYFSFFAEYRNNEEIFDPENIPFSAVNLESINNEAHFPKDGITNTSNTWISTLEKTIIKTIENAPVEKKQLLVTFFEKIKQI